MKKEETLKYPDYKEVILGVVSKLQIRHKKTGVLGKFTIKPNQLTWLKMLCSGPGKYCCVKARQQGITTITLVYLLAFSYINPGVHINIVFHKDSPAKEKLEELKELAQQLDFLDGGNAHLCVLSNGSEISCQTVAQKSKGTTTSTAGRGSSYSLLMLSEFAHYDDAEMALSSLSPALPIQGQMIIETTGDAKATLLQSIMYDADNDYKKVFFGLESDPDFAIEENKISDKEFHELQEKVGLKSRGHAAFFNEKLKESKNINACLNEYPIYLSHAFAYSSGRYVLLDPLVQRKDYTFGFRVFRDKSKDDQYILGVDVAGGVDRDASAIAILNQDGVLCASFKSSLVEIDELVDEYLTNAVNLYQPKVIVIENNYSREVEQRSRKMFGKQRISVIGQHTNTESRNTCLLLSKRAIEAGNVFGPEELQEECLSLHKDKTGRFTGKKDLLMAIGLALYHLEKLKGYRASVPVLPDFNTYIMPDFNKRKSWWQ